METIWLKSYPQGVPAEIDPHAYASISALFDDVVARFASRDAFVSMGKAITYGELDRLSQGFGNYLREELRLPPGARVALMMPNILQYPIALFGILRAGYIAVNCNPLYTPRELEHQLQDSGAEAVVIVDNRAWVLDEVIGRTAVKHVVTTGVGDMLGWPKSILVNFVVKYVRRMVPAWRLPGSVRFRTATRRGLAHQWNPPAIGHRDIAFLQYTGGTTGVPKGAMLSHRNILANLQQVHAWVKDVLKEGRETVITALPLYHVFALTANCLTCFKLAATNILIIDPRDTKSFVAELARYPFTLITGVDTLFNSLLHYPAFARIDFSRLRVPMAGGMAVHRSVAEKWKEVTGKTLIEAYGLTEASPAVTINPLNLSTYNGSIGLPLPSTTVAIRDDEGKDLPPGAVGEFCVRGPQIMEGYWNRPDETAKAMTADGFLRTGDMASVDERGFVRIVDRKKDLIVISGFKIWPGEVEEVVAMHPGVAEVGAVGIPDPVTGEALKIAVVRRDPSLTEEALIAHCRENLTGYKIPHHIEFRKELPKTNVGKILRRALRDKAA